MIERAFNYSLTALGLTMLGIFAHVLSLGAYELKYLLQDVGIVMWSIAMTDCIYNIIKGFMERE